MGTRATPASWPGNTDPMAVREVEMGEPQVADATLRRLMTVATLIIYAAVIGIAYVSDRTYRRWLKENRRWLRENHPLAAHQARLERMGSAYRERRAGVTEAAQVIGGLLGEVAGALEMERARVTEAGAPQSSSIA